MPTNSVSPWTWSVNQKCTEFQIKTGQKTGIYSNKLLYKRPKLDRSSLPEQEESNLFVKFNCFVEMSHRTVDISEVTIHPAFGYSVSQFQHFYQVVFVGIQRFR